MRVTAECIPCYLTQCIHALKKGGWPQESREDLLVRILPVIAGLDTALTPAENSTQVLHKLVELTGGRDLFAQAKRESNTLALSYLEKLRGMMLAAEDPVKMALKFAVAGNVIDLGIFEDYDLEGAIREVLETDLTRDDYPGFRQQLAGAGQVMIIGDNSGEIVFDRLLVEAIQSLGTQVVYGVKGSFILNDATVEDAREAGLDRICRIVTNGNNYLGTLAEKCSQEFLSAVKASDLVISKGQANYESLEGTDLAGTNTYFLLKAKCPVVAGHLGVEYGDLVFAASGD